jgi:hypothetical protein
MGQLLTGFGTRLASQTEYMCGTARIQTHKSTEDVPMKIVKLLAVLLVVLSSFPFFAQQQNQDTQQNPDTQQSNPPGAQTQATQAPASHPAARSDVSAADMRPVNAELVSKLDSKTARTGDSVVLKTRTSVKTADGVEIPKGSKLVGRITSVQPSGDSAQNSQVAIQFEQAELKGGQNLPIQSVIQSVAPSDSEMAANRPDTAGGAMSAPPVAGPGSSGAGVGSRSNPTGGSAGPPVQGSTEPSGAESGSGAAANGGPAPGTVVAKSGNISIRATSIPGVLLAVNEPGQADPRMGQSSGILLGAKRDVQLNSGTQLVLAVSAASGGTR